MSTAKNDITGDIIATKKPSDAYRDGWDRIFGNKTKEEPKVEKKVEKDSPKTNKSKRK
jgi:hypothetical protein